MWVPARRFAGHADRNVAAWLCGLVGRHEAREPSAGALRADRPARFHAGLRAPPPSEPPRQVTPGRSRQSVSPRRPPRGHTARGSLGLLPGHAPSPWLPLRPPPSRTSRAQPSLEWRGHRAGPRWRSGRSGHHPQAPGRSALGASMMPRLSPAPLLIVLSLIGPLRARNPDVHADAGKPYPSAERPVTPAKLLALNVCVCLRFC